MIARMEIEPTQTRFEIAAAATLLRIRRDREAAPRRIQPLLAYLEGHVYDLDLDYQGLKRACGIRDNTIPALFHQAAGLPPATYIRDCRMETAARLLSESDVKVWQITRLVGYSSLQVFGRAFKRWSKISPVVYRRRNRKHGERPRRRGSVRRSSEIAELLRRALQGQLPEADVGVLMTQLVELYPQSVRAVLAALPAERDPVAAEAPLHHLVEADRVHRIQAEALWSRLADLPFAKQREMLRRDVRLRTSDLFHLLREKGRELGRDDRARGVELAELAIESLAALDPEPSPEERAGLEARGWASLANARRLALDFRGAEAAFETAHRLLAGAGPVPDVEAEVLTLEAALYWSERRLEEALRLQDAALSTLRASGAAEPLAQGLVLRAVILNSAGRPDEAISDLEEALRRLGAGPSYLEHSAVSNLLYAYLNAGRVDEAIAALPRVRQVAARLGSRFQVLLLGWLQGLVALAAGRTEDADRELVAAREGLLTLGAVDHAAGVSLALAELRLETGDLAAASGLAAEALPMLTALGARREAEVARQTLETALAAGRLTVQVVRDVRGAVEALRRDPTLTLDPSVR